MSLFGKQDLVPPPKKSVAIEILLTWSPLKEKFIVGINPNANEYRSVPKEWLQFRTGKKAALLSKALCKNTKASYTR